LTDALFNDDATLDGLPVQKPDMIALEAQRIIIQRNMPEVLPTILIQPQTIGLWITCAGGFADELPGARFH